MNKELQEIEDRYNDAFERGMRMAVGCLVDSMDEVEERMRAAPVDYTSRLDEFEFVLNDILGLKDPHAQKLGKLGGKARAAKLTPQRRLEISKLANKIKSSRPH